MPSSCHFWKTKWEKHQESKNKHFLCPEHLSCLLLRSCRAGLGRPSSVGKFLLKRQSHMPFPQWRGVTQSWLQPALVSVLILTLTALKQQSEQRVEWQGATGDCCQPGHWGTTAWRARGSHCQWSGQGRNPQRACRDLNK